MTVYEFTVYGIPRPQGSKRHIGQGRMVEQSPHVKAWRQDVKEAALNAIDGRPPFTGAVILSVTFCFPRPKSHFRTGASTRHLLRDSAPVNHLTTPDLDKLARAMCDALTAAGAWKDDAQVIGLYVHKQYVDPDQAPQALVHIAAPAPREEATPA